jgi:hypothetical protein
MVVVLSTYTSTERVSISAPSGSDSNYSSMTSLGNFKVQGSSLSIEVKEDSQKIVFLTGAGYHRASSNQSLMTGFFYVPETRSYLLGDDLSFHSYLLSDFSDIRVKYSGDSCRFPVAFTSSAKVNFSMLNGVLEIITEGAQTSISEFLQQNGEIPKDEWVSVHPFGQHQAEFLYLVCPFYEDQTTKHQVQIEFKSNEEIVLGGNLAESLIQAMALESSVEEDQIIDQLKDSSPIKEDVVLQKYGSGKIRFLSTEDFTIRSGQEVHHTVILRLKSDLFGFSQVRKFGQFDLTVEFEDSNRDQVDSVYFLFENDTDSRQEVELILSNSSP